MKRIVIDTVNFSSYFTDPGYQVGYVSKDGGQGGMMLNGSESVDELAVKSVITLPCMPLDEGQLNRLLEVLMPTPLHTVEYFDPRFGGQRTAIMKRSMPTMKYRGFGTNAKEYWTGMVIELTEK